jgi:hypothetical protein
MGIFRNIALLLSLLVMVGHDVVPHTHADDDLTSEQSAKLPDKSNHGQADIQNTFSHLQHGSGGLLYLSTCERKHGFQVKLFQDLSFLESADNRLAWYSNHRKHRFWEYVPVSITCKLNSFALRGPPFF